MTVTVKMRRRRIDSGSSLNDPRSNSIRLKNMSIRETLESKMTETGTEETMEGVVGEVDR